jgi:antirestriction protein ArdC
MTQPSPATSVASYPAPSPSGTPRADIYARVTDRIVADLASGVRPWAKPWTAPAGQKRARITLPVRSNGTPYRGVNVLLLWGAALDRGFSAPMWMTYRQAQELGGQVRKGEAGSLVVFANRITKSETGDDGADVEREIPVMKGYTVFNVEQIDGLPERYARRPAPAPDLSPDLSPGPRPHQVAEAFFAATGAVFRHGGGQAFYAPARDVIQLPPVAAFRDAEAYASVKAHELVHWTGHPSRNARAFGKRFGDHAYAFEELVAELGAAFLCAHLGVTPEIREDHAAYLANWLQVLQQDKRAIFTAATHAQRAVDYLQGLQMPQGATVAEATAA